MVRAEVGGISAGDDVIGAAAALVGFGVAVDLAVVFLEVVFGVDAGATGAAFDVEVGFGVVNGVVASAEGAFVVATGAGAGTGAGAASTPHLPTGLLPGSLSKTPSMTSLIGLSILQDVEGSFNPPIRPGHLSIPELPASQLSMIC